MCQIIRLGTSHHLLLTAALHEEGTSDDDESEPRMKRRRVKRPKLDQNTSTWAILLQRSEELNDPDSHEGKKFRRRFRVPFPVFNYFLLHAVCYIIFC